MKFLRKKRNIVLFLIVFVVFIAFAFNIVRTMYIDSLITVNEKKIDNIPVVETYLKDSTEEMPLVILQHGLTGNKDDLKDLAKYLVFEGYFVVMPDAYGHGDYKIDNPTTVIEAAVKTGENFDKIIENYLDNELVNTDKYALIGFSMGGLSSFYSAANSQYTPTFIGSIVSTPKFDTLLQSEVSYQCYFNGNLTTIDDQETRIQIDAYSNSHSPFELIKEKEKINYFFINGDKDSIVSYEGAQLLHNSVIEKNVSNSEFYLVEDMTHDCNDQGFNLLFNMIESMREVLITE